MPNRRTSSSSDLKGDDTSPVFSPRAAAAFGIRHIRNGAWDLFHRPGGHPDPSSSKKINDGDASSEIVRLIPYAWRYAHEIFTAAGGWLVVFSLVSLVQAVIPAIRVYFSAEMLNLTQVVIEKQEIDKERLLYTVVAHAACSAVDNMCSHFTQRNGRKLQRRVEKVFDRHLFHARIRLDVPTFEDPAVQGRLSACYSYSGSMGWAVFEEVLSSAVEILNLVSRVSVVAKQVYDHDQQGSILTVLCFSGNIATTWLVSKSQGYELDSVTIANDKTVRSINGLSACANDKEHRQEIVTGGLQEHIRHRYEAAKERIGDAPSSAFEVLVEALYPGSWVVDTCIQIAEKLPEIYLAFYMLQSPSTFATSFATLRILQENATSLAASSCQIFARRASLFSCFKRIRDFYEIINIPNKIIDGTEAYPIPDSLDDGALGTGIEFRSVSFRYPGAKQNCLQDVSFTIKPGQLCVIVGANGEGKSTIVKLINRMYDCDEGKILFDGKDVKSFKLADLHKRISVLYQECHHLPVSVGENIGMGNPQNVDDKLGIIEAAKLGGASDFIEKLTDGFDTVLAQDLDMVVVGEGGSELYEKLVEMKLLKAPVKAGLSGGQMQRLALSRTFMRPPEEVTLCLYDEPSAALDPQAEYDLFQRLRALKGKKTMVFSSHRFGHLTKHADIILFMKEGTICEAGTHTELLAKDGHYASLYNIQAQAFQG
ncbi:hypothetical protein BOTBODRAFT_152372 [Botryobasidium botryosum FD-172 SS1]|uniref:ABC transporter domain-containing protein n=1 Tax=Botryobasidium botryosum (strain FD-172 SS1) TaxID=930990 RepID=A0A067MW89_BOTB1|nr:hypothetical protein BOTBODRAFT_152372 [Botryobasidium botryosum FD-172 SS1]